METASTARLPSVTSDFRAARAITIAIVAMGGEGGGVLADWIVDLAEHAGYLAQTTSVPGVAQRTGTTIYYIEIFPEAAAHEAGKQPVLALMPVPGELDIVLASELMEAGRAIQRGLVTPDRTILIASTHRVYSMIEKTALGDGQIDAQKLIEAGSAAAKVFVRNDFARIAAESGSVISAALFGALARSGALPFGRKEFEDAIHRAGVGVESSLAGFSAAFDAASGQAATTIEPAGKALPNVGPRLKELAARIDADFPPASRAILLAGVQRLADYQDVSYAAAYLNELQAVRDLDARYGNGDLALMCETGRHLALWMSYEDAVRVADLKTRRTRFARVREESQASAAQLVQINEFLYPGIEEISDILPARLGRWLLNSSWARNVVQRFTRHGKVVQTTSLRGFLQLYVLAAMRPWRRASLRFHEESKAISVWLAQVVALARQNYPLAVELAQCPTIVKGYGETHVRGRKHFDEILTALAKLHRTENPAESLKKLREAALADDTGQKLGEALRELPA
ncbi:MAG: indolepyruvate oxidoreductase subunit beta family protein [Candidatus Acidiferrales bacterium]